MALHGMGAFTQVPGDDGLSLPPAEWAVVAARTRAAYLADLRAVLRPPDG
jgi:hypothetical protein